MTPRSSASPATSSIDSRARRERVGGDVVAGRHRRKDWTRALQRREWIMSTRRLPTLTMTSDIVIFTIRGEHLEILLIQRGNPPFQGSWALPGGLVEPG